MLPPRSNIIGVGHDVVEVSSFAAQLAEPGTRMLALFSVRERRQCAARAQAKHDAQSTHLAARWAGKEAVLKAWCDALGERPAPYTVDTFPWARIEILDDSQGRPHVMLAPDVRDRLAQSLGLTGPTDAGWIACSGHGDGTLSAGAPHDAAESTGRGRSPRERPTWHISLSHDGPVASAVVLLAKDA